VQLGGCVLCLIHSLSCKSTANILSLSIECALLGGISFKERQEGALIRNGVLVSPRS